MKSKKIFKIIYIIILCSILLAIPLTEKARAFELGDLTGTTSGTSEIQEAGNQVVQIVSTIGSILSVIVIIVLGIKYMTGSVEEKAEYKKTLIPYIIGAAFIFSASTIASIVYNFAINLE